MLDVEERASADIAAAIATGGGRSRLFAEHALPDSVERFFFNEDRLMLVASKRSDLANRPPDDFVEVTGRDFVGLTASTASQFHISNTARLGARPLFGPMMLDFDAICQMVRRDVGVAVMPEPRPGDARARCQSC